MEPLTDNQTRLRDALPGPGQPGATPALLADATGLAYSTVTRLLRELRELAIATRDEDAGTWHTTTGDTATPPDRPADQLTEAAPDADDDPVAAPDPDIEIPHADPAEDLRDPPAFDDEPSPLQAAADPAGGAGHEPDHDATPEPSPVAPADPAPDQPAARTRLGKGELRDMVMAALVDAGTPLGPTELSRLLDGRSQGAITNACDKLAAAGLIVQTSEHPRRWAATASPAASGTAA